MKKRKYTVGKKFVIYVKKDLVVIMITKNIRKSEITVTILEI